MAAPGGSVVLNVALAESGGGQPSSLEWSLTYLPADISAVNVAAAPALTGASKTVQCNAVSGGATCVASGLNDNVIAAGTVATVTLQIAQSPAHSSISVGLGGVVSAAGDGTAVAASGSGGTITLTQSVGLNTLSCSATNITTPGSTTCAVSANGNAPSGGLVVGLTSSSALLSSPASVTIPAGSSSASFGVTASSVSNTSNATLTATAGGVSKSVSLTLLPPSVPVTILSGLSCAPTTLSSGSTSTCTVGLANAAAANITVAVSSNNSALTVPNSISIGAGLTAATFAAKAGTLTSPGSATVTATGPNNSVNSNAIALTIGFGPGPFSIWSPSAVPGTISDPDNNPVELGLKFRSDVAGSVTGIRFYKGPQNTGIHAGHFWTSSGGLLATILFSTETASGWQQASFSTPVSIQANTTYVVSYYSPRSHYSSDEYYFNSAVNTPPLHALQNGADGSNGVYVYGSSAFPSQSWNASNYWVDVVFSPSTAVAALSVK